LGYYSLYNERDTARAIQWFKLNVRNYPDSSNVYDSLAEAYAVKGEKQLAIENYKKSLKLNPENQNGAKELKKLEMTAGSRVEE
jgi:tetratricopeptide (TPR) repeat protein